MSKVRLRPCTDAELLRRAWPEAPPASVDAQDPDSWGWALREAAAIAGVPPGQFYWRTQDQHLWDYAVGRVFMPDPHDTDLSAEEALVSFVGLLRTRERRQTP
jgi:hypothetical protein